MAYTKTEIGLIRKLLDSNLGFYGIDSGYGQGPCGGNIRWGSRKLDALNSLIKKGILKRISLHKSIDYNNGYSIKTSSIRYTWA